MPPQPRLMAPKAPSIPLLPPLREASVSLVTWRPATRGGEPPLVRPKPSLLDHLAVAPSPAAHPSAQCIRWRPHVVAPSCWNGSDHVASIATCKGWNGRAPTLPAPAMPLLFRSHVRRCSSIGHLGGRSTSTTMAGAGCVLLPPSLPAHLWQLRGRVSGASARGRRTHPRGYASAAPSAPDGCEGGASALARP